MSHSFVAMVTFHIPEIAPSSGWWVVLSLSFNKADAHTELAVLLSVSLSPASLLVCLLENGESWRPDDSKLIQPVADGDVLVGAEWFRPPCVTFVSALLKCAFPNNVFAPKSQESLFSFSWHIFVVEVSNVVCDMNALIWKHCAKPVKKKRKCYLLLCHILSFVFIFPVDLVTFCFF